MSTIVEVQDDAIKDIRSPLLTKSTSTSSNDQQEFGSNNHVSISEAHVISFEKINYTIVQTTNHNNGQKWKNMFSCCNRTPNKQILFDLSGIFRPGMNAILGPTGCGKTTLLDILADRKNRYGLTGHILVAGCPRSTSFKHTVGYVIQDDIISGTLTVRENLMFSANIRLPHSLSAHQRVDRVNQVIDDLDLHSCVDTLIGTDFVRGVSGGEKKRTSIGMELVLSPGILFLDEPTTGLDASTAHKVMDCLNSLAQRGRTIIFSIHQPRYSIFKLFDTVLFLSAGHMIYSGSPSGVLPYFTSHGFECGEHENPADFALDVLIQSNNRSSKTLQTAYRDSCTHQTIISLLRFDKDEKKDTNLSLSIEDIPRSPAAEFYYLAQRAVRNAVRNPALAASQTIIALTLGLLTGLLFFRMQTTIDPGISNRLGAIFFLATHQILSTASALEPLIKERVLFSHENSSGYYRISSFFLVKIFCDLIAMRIIPSFIFSIIVYPLAGFQRTTIRFLIFFLTIFVSSVFGSALCFFIAACIPVFAIALIVAILSFCIMMVFSGFLVDLESIFPVLQWIQWISAIRYSSNLLTINEFRHLTFCLSNNSFICPMTGEQVLEQRNIPYETNWDMWKNLLAISFMALVFFLMAYIQLLRIRKVK